jgi:hypothetical protein
MRNLYPLLLLHLLHVGEEGEVEEVELPALEVEHPAAEDVHRVAVVAVAVSAAVAAAEVDLHQVAAAVEGSQLRDGVVRDGRHRDEDEDEDELQIIQEEEENQHRCPGIFHLENSIWDNPCMWSARNLEISITPLARLETCILAMIRSKVCREWMQKVDLIFQSTI